MLRYIVVLALALILVAALSPIVRACPTSLNLIPTADVMESGSLSLQYENDGYEKPYGADAENLYFIQVGITPRLEAGVDFCSAGSSTETVLNAKYQLLTETKTRPAFSIGTMGIGKGYKPTYYAAAAKDLGPGRLHLGATGDKDTAELLAGYEYSLNDDLCLMADYIGGHEGYASVGACKSTRYGVDVLVAYGFSNDSSNENLLYVNVAYEIKLFK